MTQLESQGDKWNVKGKVDLARLVKNTEDQEVGVEDCIDEFHSCEKSS